MSTTRIAALTNLDDLFNTGLRGQDDPCLTAIGPDGAPTHYTRGAFEAEAVRAAVESATSVKALYESAVADDYAV